MQSRNSDLVGMELPDCCVRWLAANASSNTELASISNVCTRWRKITADSILDLARNSLNNSGDAGNQNMLLLPSMVRFAMSKERKTNNDIETYCLAWFTPAGIRFKNLALNAEEDSSGDENDARTMDGIGPGSPREFAPGGEHMYAGSEDEESKKKKNRRMTSRAQSVNSLKAKLQQSNGDDSRVNCLYQWDGLQTADQVLGPFGYSSTFVKV